MKNILPAFRPYLTDIEFLEVAELPGNVAQVDELVNILLTKENKDFGEFCRVCKHHGYPHWARQLKANASVRQQEAEGTR